MKKTLAILVALLILAPAAHAGLIGFTNTAGNFFEIERLPAMRAQIRLTPVQDAIGIPERTRPV